MAIKNIDYTCWLDNEQILKIYYFDKMKRTLIKRQLFTMWHKSRHAYYLQISCLRCNARPMKAHSVKTVGSNDHSVPGLLRTDIINQSNGRSKGNVFWTTDSYAAVLVWSQKWLACNAPYYIQLSNGQGVRIGKFIGHRTLYWYNPKFSHLTFDKMYSS